MAIPESQTHYIDSHTSRSIISVHTTFTGKIRIVPDLGEDVGMSSLDSCELTGAAAVSGTSLTVDADAQGAVASVTISVAGTYTVTWTYATTDSQTAVVDKGTLIAS
jgi:hypothetical protein